MQDFGELRQILMRPAQPLAHLVTVHEQNGVVVAGMGSLVVKFPQHLFPQPFGNFIAHHNAMRPLDAFRVITFGEQPFAIQLRQLLRDKLMRSIIQLFRFLLQLRNAPSRRRRCDAIRVVR